MTWAERAAGSLLAGAVEEDSGCWGRGCHQALPKGAWDCCPRGASPWPGVQGATQQPTYLAGEELMGKTVLSR